MEGTAGAPPQRVCPNCARISWATGPQCPYCRASFRRKTAPQFAWMLAAAVLVTLAGVLVMLVIAGQHLNDQLDTRVSDVQQSFNTSLTQLKAQVDAELNQRLPRHGSIPIPTATPVPSVTPAPSASDTPTPTETPAPGATASATSTPASGRATPTPTPIIEP